MNFDSQSAKQQQQQRSTRAARSGLQTAEPSTPIVPPIVHSVSYRVNSVQHFQQLQKSDGYFYIRSCSPTCQCVEKAVNELECGAGTVLFGSGMAAISTTLLTFLRAGDHVVAGSPLYGTTHRFMTTMLQKSYNIDVTFVDGSSVEAYRAAIRPNTKMLYGETPSNPLLTVLDLEKLVDVARESGQEILTAVDATFASPFLLKPILLGIDISIHSATKYLGGHEDICSGVATTRTKQQHAALLYTRNLLGGIQSPHDASLLLRGMKTLGVRMERECDTAHQVALFLNTHPAVCRVHYPGLPSHPQHAVAARQMHKFGAMVSFEVKGGMDAAITVCNSLRSFKLALSLGGTDSLVEHAATMTHGPMSMTEEDRIACNIPDGLIRLSIGLQTVDELAGDLQQALDLITCYTAPQTTNTEP